MILVTSPSEYRTGTPTNEYRVVVTPSAAITYTAQAGFPEIKLEQIPETI